MTRLLPTTRGEKNVIFLYFFEDSYFFRIPTANESGLLPELSGLKFLILFLLPLGLPGGDQVDGLPPAAIGTAYLYALHTEVIRNSRRRTPG